MNRKAKILIVDDAFIIRWRLAQILTAHGHQVIAVAGDGREAVEKYKVSRPEVVIMDIVLPKMDGVEVVKEMMKIDKNAKIIMCTALGQEWLVLEALQAGAKAFIVKPFNEGQILEAIDKVLSPNT